MLSKELVAHTPAEGSDKWQTLLDHLANVAAYSTEFADQFRVGEWGRSLGFLHDLGKASAEFQSYLRRCHAAKQRGEKPPASKVDHKLAGAIQAQNLNMRLGLLAIPILGHHGGMPHSADAGLRIGDPEAGERAADALKAAASLLPSDLCSAPFPSEFTANNLVCELFLRMLYSCLVDADFLDTESHLNGTNAGLRGYGTSISNLWVRFQNNQACMMRNTEATPVNEIRRQIYNACLSSAELPQGVFRLTVPTGGGKTRSGMAFALKHAVKHNMKRVIVAIPYTSIIDQNAREYRAIFWHGNVLEHHSAIAPPDPDHYSEDRLKMELASENWDAPVVVTTTVQLFESLFSNKPSKCRKLHSLANSVIILDEVQTLPLEMMQPILDMLKELVAHYGVSLVLSTATQPAFSGNSPYLQGFPECSEIVPDSTRYFSQLRRVEYRVEQEPWSWGQVAETIKDKKRTQVLCVVNSRKDAVELLNLLDDPEALHLSTLMCPAHRRKVLDEIRRRLRHGMPCRVVSTQVVEAGVDLDFPCVMRASGPLDRIVQAAGRCNREGRMDGMGEVIIFQPEKGRAPRGTYATAMAEASRMLRQEGADLHDPRVFDSYFRVLWQDCNLDAQEITVLRRRLNYPEIASRFKMIGDETVPVLVPYSEEMLEDLIQSIRQAGRVTRDDWRHIQQYSVSLGRREFIVFYREGGLISEVLPGSGLFRWFGGYDLIQGISHTALNGADLVVG